MNVKVVVMGLGGVGKSTLVVQYVNNQFIEKYDPTIEDSYMKQVELNGKQYMLEIVDTAGTEQFTAMRDVYLQQGQGFVVVYSVVQGHTFDELQPLYDQILLVKKNSKVPIVLCSNKIDLADQRKITTEQGKQLAEKWGNVPFIEASAKTRENVDQVFETALREVLKTSGTTGKPAKKKGCIVL